MTLSVRLLSGVQQESVLCGTRTGRDTVLSTRFRPARVPEAAAGSLHSCGPASLPRASPGGRTLQNPFRPGLGVPVSLTSLSLVKGVLRLGGLGSWGWDQISPLKWERHGVQEGGKEWWRPALGTGCSVAPAEQGCGLGLPCHL